METEFQNRNFPFGMEMTQNVWKWKWGFKTNFQTMANSCQNAWFSSRKTLLFKFQYTNRLAITSTNNFVPEKTSIPSLEHRKFLPCARYTEPWADLEFWSLEMEFQKTPTTLEMELRNFENFGMEMEFGISKPFGMEMKKSQNARCCLKIMCLV